MKKTNLLLRLSIAMIILSIVFFIALFAHSIKLKKDKKQLLEKILLELSEQSYFEGQKDYMNSDIRIEKTNDSCYAWTKSPWDSGRKPTFNPCKKK